MVELSDFINKIQCNERLCDTFKVLNADNTFSKYRCPHYRMVQKGLTANVYFKYCQIKKNGFDILLSYGGSR